MMQIRVFGAPFIGNDAVHSYMYATQSSVNPYKADGTSNFDDPAFAKSMGWFFSLGNDLKKIQPSSVEVVASGTYPYNSFMIGDNIGLYVCGGWVASTLTTLESIQETGRQVFFQCHIQREVSRLH